MTNKSADNHMKLPMLPLYMLNMNQLLRSDHEQVHTFRFRQKEQQIDAKFLRLPLLLNKHSLQELGQENFESSPREETNLGSVCHTAKSPTYIINPRRLRTPQSNRI